MTKPLIALPRSAQELENALHAVCDQGLRDAKVCVEEVFVPISDAPSYVVGGGITHKRVARLVIETETKGNANEQPNPMAKG